MHCVVLVTLVALIVARAEEEGAGNDDVLVLNKDSFDVCPHPISSSQQNIAILYYLHMQVEICIYK